VKKKRYHHSEAWHEVLSPQLESSEELNFKFLNVDFYYDDDKVMHLGKFRRR
jgi:hypothetical protein